jgi:hypothetical protein
MIIAAKTLNKEKTFNIAIMVTIRSRCKISE